MNKVSRVVLAAAVLAALAAGAAQAQSSCSSDGVPRAAALLERFINADCETCWSDTNTPKAGRGELALDWIVPGSRGEAAPLAAAASRDSLARLETLQRPVPPRATTVRHPAAPAPRQLRVAHGLAFNGYIGTSIQLRPGSGGPWNAWLLLVETLPAGSAGSPVERNLVRNALRPDWDMTRALSKQEQRRLFESRPMSIPEGARPNRLRVVGMVQDQRGRLVAATQSRCAGR